MVSRRELLAGGVLTAGVGLQVNADQATNELLTGILGELRSLREATSCGSGSCPLVESVRLARKQHFKSVQRFPDYIDVGYDVWDQVYDWQIRNAIQPNVRRLPDGRQGLLVFQTTTLVLRPDHIDTFVGQPYDR
jgi:hypothetical protein